MTLEPTLPEILSLLTKVSDRLSIRLLNVEKRLNDKTKQTGPKPVATVLSKAQPQVKKETIPQKVANVIAPTSPKPVATPLSKAQPQVKRDAISQKVANVIAPTSPKQPKEVIAEDTPVVINDIGDRALDKIQKLLPVPVKKVAEQQEKVEDSPFSSWLKRLIGPALLILGGLAEFIQGLLSNGPLKGLLHLLGKGGILAGISLMKKLFAKSLGELPHLISKLLPIKALKGAVNMLLSPFKWIGKTIMNGMRFLAVKAKGLIPVNFFAAIFKHIKTAFSSITKVLLKPFAGLAKGVGKDLFAKIASGLGKILKPILKRIPGIGTLLDWGSAYFRFKKGDVIGGLIDIASGIASIFPGPGTVISIGLGVLNAFLDYKAGGVGEKAKPKGVVISDWFKKIKNKLILAIWRFIPDFTIAGFSVKNKLAEYLGIDIPGMQKEQEIQEQAEQIELAKKKQEEQLTAAKETKEESQDTSSSVVGETTDVVNKFEGDAIPEESNIDNINVPENYEDIHTEGAEFQGHITSARSDNAKVLKETADNLKKLIEVSGNLLNRQIEMIGETNHLLQDMSNKLAQQKSLTTSMNKSTVNNIFPTMSIRELQTHSTS